MTIKKFSRQRRHDAIFLSKRPFWLQPFHSLGFRFFGPMALEWIETLWGYQRGFSYTFTKRKSTPFVPWRSKSFWGRGVMTTPLFWGDFDPLVMTALTQNFFDRHDTLFPFLLFPKTYSKSWSAFLLKSLLFPSYQAFWGEELKADAFTALLSFCQSLSFHDDKVFLEEGASWRPPFFRGFFDPSSWRLCLKFFFTVMERKSFFLSFLSLS